MVKIYMDCEMTGLSKNDDLISLGLLYQDTKTGVIKTFYAEFNDYDSKKVDEWVQLNVIDKLKFNDKQSIEITSAHDVRIKADREYIAQELKNWIDEIDEWCTFVADVGHYDVVFVFDLFGGAFRIPRYLSPSYHDLNNDIAEYLKINEFEAFNINRETFLIGLGLENTTYDLVFRGQDKHNALYDARVCYLTHKKLEEKKKETHTN